MDAKDTIVVFTARSPTRIIAEGGSQAWVLNARRAQHCKWLVCTQNQHNPDVEFSDATEPHGSAFLVAKISALRRCEEEGSGDRWLIAISDYAQVSLSNMWDHGRNPVRYTNLRELGIDPSTLKFNAMPATTHAPASAPARTAASMTIEEAKAALAVTFGVKPEAIEIIIRG